MRGRRGAHRPANRHARPLAGPPIALVTMRLRALESSEPRGLLARGRVFAALAPRHGVITPTIRSRLCRWHGRACARLRFFITRLPRPAPRSQADRSGSFVTQSRLRWAGAQALIRLGPRGSSNVLNARVRRRAHARRGLHPSFCRLEHMRPVRSAASSSRAARSCCRRSYNASELGRAGTTCSAIAGEHGRAREMADSAANRGRPAGVGDYGSPRGLTRLVAMGRPRVIASPHSAARACTTPRRLECACGKPPIPADA